MRLIRIPESFPPPPLRLWGTLQFWNPGASWRHAHTPAAAAAAAVVLKLLTNTQVGSGVKLFFPLHKHKGGASPSSSSFFKQTDADGSPRLLGGAAGGFGIGGGDS